MENIKPDQMLSIKVMRLSRPHFSETCDWSLEPWDLLSSLSTFEHYRTCENFVKKTESGVANYTLVLPQSFGTIYLGETFQSYLRVQNTSFMKITNMTVKADLQTASQRLPLISCNNVCELEPEQSIDEVLNHEITEVGTHILVCEVSYKGSNSEQLTSSRYYKFQVLKPLDVKTKFYNAESDDVYLEAQIQNITMERALHLNQVLMEPSPFFKVTSLCEMTSLRNAESIKLYGKIVDVVQPTEIRQYLHCLKPITCVKNDIRTLRQSNIGKLDLLWRTSFGDRGRLQTSQLMRMVPNYGDIRLTVEHLPNPVKLHHKVNIVCRVANTSERPVDLCLVFEIRCKPTVLWSCLSNRPLEKIEPNRSICFSVTIIPISPGLHSVNGLKLIDLFLKRTYDYPDLAQILVIP